MSEKFIPFREEKIRMLEEKRNNRRADLDILTGTVLAGAGLALAASGCGVPVGLALGTIGGIRMSRGVNRKING